MRTTDPDYIEIFEENGEPETLHEMTADELAAVRGRLPDHLVALMQTYGRSRLRKGLLFLIHPNDLAGIFSELLGKDPDLGKGKTHPYLMTAFGTVHFWNERFGLGKVNFVEGEVYCDELTDPSGDTELNLRPAYVPFFLDDDQHDFDDDAEGKPLFKRALKKLGMLDYMQLYSFVPAISLGGEFALGNLKINNAPAHLAILMQATEFKLFGTDDEGELVEGRAIV